MSKYFVKKCSTCGETPFVRQTYNDEKYFVSCGGPVNGMWHVINTNHYNTEKEAIDNWNKMS